LDKSLKEDLLNQLRSILRKTKIPAIYVTHDQDEAFTIADRILLLHDGEIIRDGTPDEVWNNPNSVHAARMLGMGNIVEGVVTRMNDEGGTLRVNVSTEFGTFDVKCERKHSAGEKVSLLIKQSGEGDEIQLKVEDVLFNRDQFQVKAGSGALSGEAVSKGGLVIHMKDAPKIGQIISVQVQVECLT